MKRPYTFHYTFKLITGTLFLALLFSYNKTYAATPTVTVTTPTNSSTAHSIPAYSASGTTVGITALSTADAVNLALSRPTFTSSVERSDLKGSWVVDNITTSNSDNSNRWSSQQGDTEYITIDLGAVYDIDKVVLNWEAAYGKAYKIQTSTTNTNGSFTTIYNTSTGNGGVDNITGLSGSGRYVRMQGVDRATQYGYSLYEFQIYSGVSPIVYSLTDDAGGRFTINSSTGVVTVDDNTSLAAGTYNITVNAASGSVNASKTFSIAVTSTTPTISGAGSGCGAGSVILTAGNGGTGGTYNWFNSSTGTSIATGTTYAPSLTGTYYVSYTQGATTTAKSTGAAVTIYTIPTTPVFTATSLVITGAASTVTLLGTYDPSLTYAWNFGGGTPSTGTGQGPFSVQWSTMGTKTITLTVTGAGGCTATASQTVTVVSKLADYGFSKALVLNTSQITHGGISSTLANFPALVYIQDDALIIGANCGDKVQFPTGNGGGLTAGTNYDFAFTLPGGTDELSYQVDTYDSVHGILFCWVRIPSLTSTNLPITFYFGSRNPTHSATWTATTWASDYKAVYHFNEASTSAPVLDATSAGRNAVQANTAVTNDEIHIAANVPIPGGGYSFNGSSSSIIQNVGTNPDITGKFTLSAWAYYNGDDGDDNKIISNEINYTQGYKLSVKYGKLETETRYVGGDGVGNLGTGGAVSGRAWHYIQGVYSGVSTDDYPFTNYVDGVVVPNSSMVIRKQSGGHDIDPDDGDVAQMGIDYLKKTTDPNDSHRATNWYNGYMDEVRISNTIKTADWIRAEYYNQTKPVDFTNFSAAAISYKDNAPNLVGAVSYTWTGLDGSSNTDQAKEDNWDAGYTPVFNGNTKMIIPVVSSGKYPVLTADASVYSLTIAAGGAYLDLNGHTLSVGCNIYNNTTTGGKGILNANNSNSGVTWVGSLPAQYYYGKNVKNTAEIGNMKVDKSVVGTVSITGGPIDIYNTVTLTKGNLVIDNAGDGDMTLKSSSTITASVAAIPSTYSITGNVNVERYISGGALKYRGYRFLSSPVYTVKSSSNYYYDLSYLMTEVPMTGTLGGSGGMDRVGNPSVYLYRNDVMFTNGSFNGGNFRGINTINNSIKYQIGIDIDNGPFALHVGTGFWMFYRGDKTNLASKFTTNTIPEETALVSRGTLNQQAVTVVNWYTQLPTLQYSMMNGTSYAGYNLVGNPYASSIDWNTRGTTAASGIYITNVSPTIYIYNESTKIYGTYNGTLGVNGATNIIPSGQGFYVKATGPSAQLTFNEAGKTSVQYAGPTAATGNTLLLSTKPVRDTDPLLQYMRLQLFKDSDNIEESIVQFTETAKNEFVDSEDSEHMTGSGGVSFSSNSSDNIALAINLVSFPKTKTTVIRLNVDAAASGQYTINKTEFKNIPTIYDMWLKDAYKKDSLDIKNNSTYTFDILKTDTNSFGSHRFTLVIRENPALGLHLLNFAASKTISGSELVWKVENERYSTNFTVERSTDNGKTYSVLGGFASSDEGTYSFTDKKPIIAADTYRIKLEDLNGTITYSKAITLQYANVSDINNNAVNIYPNPAVGVINVAIVENSVNLTKSDNPSYSLKITNSSGKILKTVTTSQATWQDNIAALMPGTYVVDVTNNADNSRVGKAKFVKL